MSFGNLIAITVCAIIMVNFREVAVQPTTTFIRTCASPLVTNHSNNYRHSYCYHACGLIPNNGISPATDPTTCTQDGDCLCSFPCSNDTTDQKTFSFDKDFCNPPRVRGSSDPVDPDPLAHPQCISRCASKCPGGSGVICGQVKEFESTDLQNTYLKICTCFCPVKRCPSPPLPPVTNNVTINNTNNTTIIVYNAVTNNTTTNSSNTTITAVVPSTNHLNFLDLSLLFFLLVKVYGVWALQILFMGIYSTLLY